MSIKTYFVVFIMIAYISGIPESSGINMTKVHCEIDKLINSFDTVVQYIVVEGLNLPQTLLNM